MENYSVLMSVYEKADPGQLREAIRSMTEQTVRPGDFVIVCDGPLREEQNRVLADFERKHPGLFQILRLPENVGIGAAANAGLAVCKFDLVAKMDADDIAVPERCEKQLAAFKENPDLSVLGGWIAEFAENPRAPFAVRKVPAEDWEIRRFARRRQPFNNMTVMYRRRAVLAVSGYGSYRRGEDYDLYLRLLHAGYRAGNLQEVLVNARVNRSAMTRRAGWGTIKGCIRTRWNACRMGFATWTDFLYCMAGQTLMVLSPGPVRQWLYRKYLRQSWTEGEGA